MAIICHFSVSRTLPEGTVISGCRAKTRRKSHGAGLTTSDFNTMEGRHRQDVETPVCSKLQIDDTGEPLEKRSDADGPGRTTQSVSLAARIVSGSSPSSRKPYRAAYPYIAMNSPRFLSLASMWVSTN